MFDEDFFEDEDDSETFSVEDPDNIEIDEDPYIGFCETPIGESLDGDDLFFLDERV